MSNKANELSIGEHILLDGKVRKIIEKQHVKPGKGGAYLQVVLKSLDGVKTEKRFSPSDTVDIVRVEKKKYSFSYMEKDNFVFSHPDTYETLEINTNDIPEASSKVLKIFVKEGDILDIEFANEEVVNVQFPGFITVKIDSADAVVKGQTAASSFKNAIICGSVNILVPSYIEDGHSIKINLYGDKGIEFVERVN